MLTFFLIVLILVLFYLLGKSADLVVHNSLEAAKEFGLPLVLVGVMLGLLTTLPEFALGINSITHNVPEMSVGNLLGGVVVMLSLVLGLSLFFNRRVATDGKLLTLLPLGLCLMLPIVLALDGSYSYFDGLILISGFICWVLFTYFGNGHGINFKIVTVSKGKLIRQMVLTVFGGLGILITSYWIVEVTLFLLNEFAISPFLVGILAFSIGTNLPELSIAWQSRKRSAGFLSVSHLFGSVAANVFCLGLLSFSGRLIINIGSSFFAYLLILLVLFTIMAIFYKTDKAFSRTEGVVLIIFYFVFVVLQLFAGLL
jgi:cation:H+ antiporter